MTNRSRLSLGMAGKAGLVLTFSSTPSSCISTGYQPGAPYDVIHVGAAAPTLPEALIYQLASPGRMFIPVGTGYQEIIQVDKDEHGRVTTASLMGVVVSVLLLSLSLT